MIDKYLSRLGSMDFLAKNFTQINRLKISACKKTKDALIMNTPFLKLHMNNNNENGINRTNQALTA